jgi:hypothetical protein
VSLEPLGKGADQADEDHIALAARRWPRFTDTLALLADLSCKPTCRDALMSARGRVTRKCALWNALDIGRRKADPV